MFEIKPVDYCIDDKYDKCGNTAKAVLVLEGIRILMCDECIKELNDSLEEYKNTIFCHKCDYFIMSNSGWNYGGSCKKKAELDGKEVTEKDAGYLYCVDCMNTCQYATKNIYKIYATDCGNQPCMYDDCNSCNYAYWRYKKIPYHYSHESEMNKTVFLSEEEAKSKCEEIEKEIRIKIIVDNMSIVNYEDGLKYLNKQIAILEEKYGISSIDFLNGKNNDLISESNKRDWNMYIKMKNRYYKKLKNK